MRDAIFDNYSMQIIDNKYIKRIDDIIDDFGLVGAYYFCDKTEDKSNVGVYVGIGHDEKLVNNFNLNIEELMEEQDKECLFRLDRFVIKLELENLYYSYREIINTARDMEMIKIVYDMFGKEMPKKMTYTALNFERVFYLNYINNPDEYRKQQYKEALRRAMESEDKTMNPNNPQYIGPYRAGIETLQFSQFRGKKENFVFNNEVTLEQLVLSFGELAITEIQLDDLPNVRRALKNHPNILFATCKSTGIAFDLPDGEGFNIVNQSNTFNVCRIVFGKAFQREATNVITKALAPSCDRVSPEELRDCGTKVVVFGLDADDYELFREYCERRDIDYCKYYEHDRISFKYNLHNFMVRQCDFDKVMEFFDELGQREEKYHAYNLIRKNKPTNKSLDTPESLRLYAEERLGIPLQFIK